MIVELARPEHFEGWARLRAILWTDETIEEHREAVADWLGEVGHIAFVAIEDGTVVGFVEASIRRDHVNGCITSPVAFLEGVAVATEHCGQGFARVLIHAVEDWGRAKDCAELGSDTNESNAIGQALHRHLGFEERERTVFYRKLLRVGVNGDRCS